MNKSKYLYYWVCFKVFLRHLYPSRPKGWKESCLAVEVFIVSGVALSAVLIIDIAVESFQLFGKKIPLVVIGPPSYLLAYIILKRLFPFDLAVDGSVLLRKAFERMRDTSVFAVATVFVGAIVLFISSIALYMNHMF